MGPITDASVAIDYTDQRAVNVWVSMSSNASEMVTDITSQTDKMPTRIETVAVTSFSQTDYTDSAEFFILPI